MRKSIPVLPSVALGALAALVASLLPYALAAADSSPPDARVGNLSRPEALVFEGNRTFPKEQILEGMDFHLDFYVASHREAPRADYLALLERKLTLGYQHAGFPEVKVKATAEPAAGRVMVKVNEGPRYECGDILVSGARAVANAAVKQKAAELLAGAPAGAPGETNQGQGLWLVGRPAPFDEITLRLCREAVLQALAELDYFEPKLNLQVAPDPASRRANLKIEIVHEGIKGTLEQIEVTGLRTNTRQQVLDFLKLRPAMELHLQLLTSVSNQLYHSGRFFRQNLELQPLTEVGKFKLVLDLEELRGVPPLNQELPPEAKAFLKFGVWLNDWQKHPEDLVCSLSHTSALVRAQADLVLSRSGLLLAARSEPASGPPALQYALVATPELLGFYSPWRQRKFAVPREAGGQSVAAFLTLVPDLKAQSAQRCMFSVGGGVHSKEGAPPFSMEMNLAPVALVREATRLNPSLRNGLLTFRNTNSVEDGEAELTLDPATGRLIEGRVAGDVVSARVRSEAGAFARLFSEIQAATANHPNDYATNRGFSSWVSFTTTDLIEAPLAETLLQAWARETARTNPAANPLAALGAIKSAVAIARKHAGDQHLARMLEPVNRLFPAEAGSGKEPEAFTVPQNLPPGINSLVTASVAFALARSDALVPRDSWPWVLLREAAFTLAGEGRYTEQELDRLRKSDEVGPVGCLATAVLVGRVNPRYARVFAERGLSRLTPAEFHKDYRVCLDTNSIVGELAANVLSLLGDLSDAEVASLVSGSAPVEAALVRQLSSLLRSNKNRSPAEAVWSALEQHWEPGLRRYLELGLNQFLPQVQFLTDPRALYQRGLKLVAPSAMMRDYDEAAQCFRKAADQGHAGAQLQLGGLCEAGKGVPEDFAEAMRWYRKAADQKEPHAGCRIGGLYLEGKGEPKDLNEAARWYRPDAEQGCPGAQFGLGRIYEQQQKLSEALPWYRRAAAGGNTGAQLRLGDLLSDGFSTAPDYVEACQWLLLAVEADKNKIVEIDLRRVKAKLTEQQVEEAQKRADAVTERLEEKQKETEKKSAAVKK